MNDNWFYVSNISYSQLATLIRDPAEWRLNRIEWIYDNTRWVSATIWIALHRAIEVLLTTWKKYFALECWTACIYTHIDWENYVINPRYMEFIQDKKIVWWEDKEYDESYINKDTILEDINTNKIDLWKTWSLEKIRKWIIAWLEAFISEKIEYWNILWLEYSMECEAVDKLEDWTSVSSPLPFKAISDVICETDRTRQIQVDWSFVEIARWEVFVEDHKFKTSFSKENEESWAYFFQAMFNYYCIKADIWRVPKFMIFREIKLSKNRNWNSQHNEVTIPFFWKAFERYKKIFWNFLQWSFVKMAVIQDLDFYLPNIFDFTYWNKNWQKLKDYEDWILVWHTNKINLSSSENSKIAWKNTKLWKIKVKWLDVISEEQPKNNIPYEKRVINVFRDFWLHVIFEKTIEWFSFNQLLFKTWNWVSLKKISSYNKEIQQVLEVDSVFIDAPVKWTNFIWIQVPRKIRKTAFMEELKNFSNRNLSIPIWIDINWKITTIDLTSSVSPHLIVAWETWWWKTEFLTGLVYNIHKSCNIIILDPKIIGMIDCEPMIKRRSYITNTESIIDSLLNFEKRMYLRYNFLKKKWFKDIDTNNKNWWRLKHEVLIFDEIESLMFWENKTIITDSLRRITSLWRAAWFHLILTTQRPTVNILDWWIKANISTRVCFTMWDKTSSKVVLDTEWAERLLKKGDMLFKQWPDITRLQWFLLKQESINKIT